MDFLSEAQVLALVGGTVITLGLTQMIKKATGVDSKKWVRLTAFLIGGFATYTIWPPVGIAFDWHSLWAGLAVGLWTPAGFKAFKVFAKNRGWEWVEHI